MGAAELAVAAVSGGLMFIVADGLDRFLSTYDPAKAETPKDKFVSTGAGTLANSLNVASRPTLIRAGAGVVVAALPTAGALYVKQPMARAALAGAAVGGWASAFRAFWNSFVMPMLVGKDTSPPALQKSFIARLYPAEVAAHINMQTKQTNVSASGAGALSGAPGVGAPDVGPFALQGDSPYPDAQQALRTGVHGDSPYPDASQALRAGVSGDSPYPSASQAIRAGVSAPAGHGNPGQPGLSYAPGPPDGPGPGPQADPHTDPSCGCIGDNNPHLSFLGDGEEETLFS